MSAFVYCLYWQLVCLARRILVAGSCGAIPVFAVIGKWYMEKSGFSYVLLKIKIISEGVSNYIKTYSVNFSTHLAKIVKGNLDMNLPKACFLRFCSKVNSIKSMAVGGFSLSRCGERLDDLTYLKTLVFEFIGESAEFQHSILVMRKIGGKPL